MSAAACSHCGSPVRTDELDGMCPACLMELVPDEVEEDVLSPGTEFRGMEILEQVGRGGMGIVYKARQKNLDRIVALKILSPHLSEDESFVARFHREAKLLASISHPNVVQLHEFGQDPQLFLVMEFVDGDSLEKRFEAGVEASWLLQTLAGVCRGLQPIHDSGTVHRDLKPSNILIAADGTPKIADFGLAVEAGADGRVTATGAFVGSPHYVSPEHVQDHELDGRADLYALGVILFQGLSGHVPFTARTVSAVLVKHVQEAPPLADLDGKCATSIHRLTSRLLSKSREDRPANAAEVEKMFQGAPVGGSVFPKLAIGATAGVLLLILALVLPRAGARVDLLAMIDPDRDAFTGTWRIVDGVLVPSGPSPKIDIPYQPPEQYDVEMELERITDQGAVAVTLHCDGALAAVILDRPTPEGNASGLMKFKDEPSFTIEEWLKLRATQMGSVFRKATRHRVRYQVRSGHIRVEVDSKVVLDWEGDPARLDIPRFHVPQKDARMMVLTANDSIRIHRLELISVTGTGKDLR